MTVKVLGPLETGTKPLSPRERAIFSALVVRLGTSLSMSELAEAWWGDDAPATWSAQVKNSIARIRARLGHDVIETIGSQYRLRLDPESVDAVRFERLVSNARGHALREDHDRAIDAYSRALALWRGAPYEDVAAWQPAQVEVMRLGEIRRSAEEELLDARLHAGDHRSVISDAERLVHEEPLREDRWAILALANYRSERQAEALAVLRAARRRLNEELGIEPGPRVSALETAMLRQDPAIAVAPVAPLVRADSPYRGLATYAAEDADVFFGRDTDIDAMLDRVRHGVVTAIAGPSGSGKSSLLLAGVLPRLAASGRAVPVVRPGSGGVPAVRAAVQGRDPAPVVAIDQAEELFGLSESVLDEYCAVVADYVSNGGCAILTIRSDFLDRAAALPGIGPAIGGHTYVLGPLGAAALRETIERPAAEAGLRLEPGLVEILVRDSGDRASTLPHLSHALLETWIRREGATLTIDGYEASGGIAGAIALSAEDLYRSLPPHEQELCRSLMLRLLERGDDGAAVRHRVALEPLLADADRRRVLDGLVAARLVMLDGDVVTVAHEAVAVAWPRLDDWLAESVDSMRLLRQVETAAQTWDAAGRPSDDLIRGARLHAAIEWREAARPDLTPLERAFLDASAAGELSERRALEQRAARDRTQNRRLRWALGGAAALLVTAVVAGGAAFVQGRVAATSAESERVEALAATSLALRASDRDVAALLAAELHRRWPDDSRSRSALLGSLTAAGGLVSRIVFDEGVHLAGAVVPETRTVLVVIDRPSETDAATGGSGSTELAIVDVDSGERVRVLDVPMTPVSTPYFRDVEISADGRRAVILTPGYRTPGDTTTCCVNALDIIDLSTGEKLSSSRVLDSRTGAPVLSDDGADLFLIHSVTAEPIWVDTRSGETHTKVTAPPDSFAGQDGIYDEPALTADGRLLVGADGEVVTYDSTTLRRLSSVAAPRGLTEWRVFEDGASGLLITGPDGFARIDAASGDVLWERRDALCHETLLLPPGDTFLCKESRSIIERTVATGESTGRSFDTMSDWTLSVGGLAGGTEIVAFAEQSRAAIMYWRLDGEPSVTTPIAAGRTAVDGFGAGGDVIVTAEQPDTPTGDLGGSHLWDVDADAPLGPAADEVTWLSDAVYERWSEESGSTLHDVETGREFTLARAPDDAEEFYLHAGGLGPHAFVVEERRIVPVVPDTGEPAGAPIAFPDVNLHWNLIGISELADAGRVAVTWWDVGEVAVTTAVFDLATGSELARGLREDVHSVATPDGDVVSASAARVALSTDALEPVYSFSKSGAAPSFMQVTSDGRTLLLAGFDRRVSLYDLRDGRKLGDEIATDAPQRQWWPAGFISADGRRMATNTAAGVLLWDLAPDALFDATCRLAGRELTALEWRTHFGDEPQVATCEGTQRAVAG